MKNELSRRSWNSLALACIVALVAMLVILMSSPLQAHASETLYEGRCGEATSWTLDDNGVLTISGKGAVVSKGYNDSHLAPHNFAVYGFGSGSGYIYMQHEAKSMVIGEGITSIEGDLFKNYRLIESLSLPSTLKSIEANTFSGCRALAKITFAPNSQISSIGELAFYNCRALGSIALPASVGAIGNNAFEDCMALGKVSVLPGSRLKSIGSEAFAGCSSIKALDFKAATSLSSVGANAFDSSLFSAKVTKATPKKGKKLALTWSKTLGATKYVLYYKPKAASKYSKVTVKSSSKTLKKLKKGKKYKVYVEAYLGPVKLCASSVKTTAKIKK